jgi:hypothetical protein
MTELLLWTFGFFAVISVPLWLVISWWDKGEVRREARSEIEAEKRRARVVAEIRRLKDEQNTR